MADDKKKNDEKKPAAKAVAPAPTLPNGDTIRLGSEASGLKNIALGMAVIGLGGAVATGGGPLGKQFQHSYLTAFMWGLAIAAGAVWWVAIQHLVGARWSVVVRRVGELLAQALGLMAILVLPIIGPALAGNDVLYAWADHDYFHHNAFIAGKAPYFSVGFFAARMAFYFGFWTLLAGYYFKQSKKQDTTTGDKALTVKLGRASAPGLMGFALAVTFCAIDLVMTLDPVWFSTIFGVYYFATCVIMFHSTLALALMWLQSKGHLKKSVTAEHYHDIGKMMFGFTCFWAYIGFSQFMLIWYANIPEETHWYLDRFEGTWLDATLALAAVHFVVPFFGFMSRWMKRDTKKLRFWAFWLIAVCWLDMYWLVAPNLHHAGVAIGASDILAAIGVAGAMIAYVLQRAKGTNLVPTGDPRLEQSLAFQNI